MKRLTPKETLDILHLDAKLDDPRELAAAMLLEETVHHMDGAAKDTLRAIFMRGPLEDGSVPSKSGRDTLLTHKFCAKVVVRGEEGYNACTYLGSSAFRLMTAESAASRVEG